MKAPSTDDRVVKVRAYLTDEAFGMDHWRAAQYAAPVVPSSRWAVLAIYHSKAERDAGFAALTAAQGPEQTPHWLTTPDAGGLSPIQRLRSHMAGKSVS